MQDPLDEALGLPPLPVETRTPVVPEHTTSDADYEFARESIYRGIAKIEDALDELAAVARSSQHPRAYEVYANLAKTYLDANQDLLALRKKQMETSEDRHKGPTTVNQTLMISSTDMLRAVKDAIRGSVAKVIEEE